MGPPEKRNANSNDGPLSCQGGFSFNLEEQCTLGGCLLFQLVISQWQAWPQVNNARR